MLKLYGSARSRASRTLWMLAECGVPYEQEDLSKLEGDAKSAAHHRVNPIGKMPAIEDGDLKLFESMAINLYLARSTAASSGPPATVTRPARSAWSFFCMTELEPRMVQIFFERMVRKEGERNPENEKKNWDELQRPLRVLERPAGRPRLRARPALHGGRSQPGLLLHDDQRIDNPDISPLIPTSRRWLPRVLPPRLPEITRKSRKAGTYDMQTLADRRCQHHAGDRDRGHQHGPGGHAAGRDPGQRAADRLAAPAFHRREGQPHQQHLLAAGDRPRASASSSTPASATTSRASCRSGTSARAGSWSRSPRPDSRANRVDFVVCTHLHPDHVGWNTMLVDGRWVPTFPNARYIFSARDWEWLDKAPVTPLGRLRGRLRAPGDRMPARPSW